MRLASKLCDFASIRAVDETGTGPKMPNASVRLGGKIDCIHSALFVHWTAQMPVILPPSHRQCAPVQWLWRSKPFAPRCDSYSPA
ncbi:unnamed protein product [Protopolystoma xenopodis]|uniref:Uncharacterized protein n=1 Tax=Protopolystoma xenopodis TaxID=117903 RepID=A0A3S5AWD8_9PLAT|nr:unnamed protein product [Protopolystoma xenopodis]